MNDGAGHEVVPLVHGKSDRYPRRRYHPNKAKDMQCKATPAPRLGCGAVVGSVTHALKRRLSKVSDGR